MPAPPKNPTHLSPTEALCRPARTHPQSTSHLPSSCTSEPIGENKTTTWKQPPVKTELQAMWQRNIETAKQQNMQPPIDMFAQSIADHLTGTN
ncbi:hypothetical protein CEE69_18760 [Rhodopirellula bahusiensis]|uniref:Uncharacterized protein n=1 Tax=Rhodopirellula bahusiensis TaxID=2014065 RepID=A0A2G1W3N4_9BACT|nr:hypothetical protein CEE69_18760 [Rhodopirellula bahusiensis]